jgi:hypothetical protein
MLQVCSPSWIGLDACKAQAGANPPKRQQTTLRITEYGQPLYCLYM